MTPTRHRHVWMWWAEGLLLVIGTICLAWYGWNWIASAVDQSWSEYEFNASLTRTQPTLRGYLTHIISGDTPPPRANDEAAPEPSSSAASKPAEPPAQPAPPPRLRTELPRGATLGRIEIPRLNIEAIVRSGVDDMILRRAVGHVPETALPGEPGNVGIAAHRDTFFRNLRNVKVGDLVRMVTPQGSFDYQVESLKIVLPTNVEVLDPTPEPALTLVTCYPFNFIGHAPKRFIVRAKQITETASNVSAPATAAEDSPAVTRKQTDPQKRTVHRTTRSRRS